MVAMATTPRTLPRFTTRPHVWLLTDEPLVCPNHSLTGDPHKVRTNAALLQHDAFTCQYKRSVDSAECGATVYVLAFPEGLRYLATVTVTELRLMRARRMCVGDVLVYLRSTTHNAA